MSSKGLLGRGGVSKGHWNVTISMWNMSPHTLHRLTMIFKMSQKVLNQWYSPCVSSDSYVISRMLENEVLMLLPLLSISENIIQGKLLGSTSIFWPRNKTAEWEPAPASGVYNNNPTQKSSSVNWTDPHRLTETMGLCRWSSSSHWIQPGFDLSLRLDQTGS